MRLAFSHMLLNHVLISIVFASQSLDSPGPLRPAPAASNGQPRYTAVLYVGGIGLCLTWGCPVSDRS